MAFVQMIDMHSKQFDQMMAGDEEWFAKTEGKRTLTHSLVGRDRNDPDHYVILAFFDSYEDAMTNSEMPETQHFAEVFSKLADQPIGFLDLDVVNEHT